MASANSRFTRVIKGIRKIATPNMKYFNQMKYSGFRESLSIAEKTILLESQHGAGIDGNIYHVLKELVTNPQYREYRIWVTAADKTVKKNIETLLSASGMLPKCSLVMWGSDRYYRLLASAGVLINDNTFEPSFVKREGQTYINLWHGTPLKCLGRKNLAHSHAIGNAQKNFMMADYLLFPNEYTMDHMLEDYMIEDLTEAHAILCGYPRNAVLMDKETRERIRARLGLHSARVYAYLPTWREIRWNWKLDGILREMDQLLKEDEVMYVKLHPVERAGIGNSDFNHIRILGNDVELYDFLSVADGLITDYSSVMFDFALTGKPISLYTPDSERYAEEIGTYMSLDELPWKNSSQLEAAVEELRKPANYRESTFCRDLNRYDTPDAAGMILERTILKKNNSIKEIEIKGSGREKVLIFSGNLSRNGVTSALKSYISAMDLNHASYYLLFDSFNTGINRSVIQELPEEIKYISSVGSMNLKLREKMAFIGYEFKWIGFRRFWKHAEKAFGREVPRVFYNNRFSKLIQFSGYAYKKILLFTVMDGYKTIFVHSDMGSEIETRGNQRMEVLELAYDRYDRIVAVSDSCRELTEKLIRESRYSNDNCGKLVTVYNAFDPEVIKELSHMDLRYDSFTESTAELARVQAILDSDAEVIVSVGRFSPEKSHNRLVEEFSRFREDRENRKNSKDLYLIIVGGNSLNDGYTQLQEQIANCGSRDNIILIQNMSNPYPLIRMADGFIQTSLYEGFGIALLEADCLGTPAVTTEVEGPKSFIQAHGGTMVANSSEGIYGGLEMLINHEVPLMKVDYDAMYSQFAEKVRDIIE